MVLKVGTDCSGIEAPIQALKKMKVNFSHEFSCEIDKFARESIKANYSPKILFEDITKKRKLPDIDMYVCGFPCQSFSTAGKRLGFKDTRGTIFYECLKVIKYKKPKVFVLENVKGLTFHDKGKTFKIILDCLNKLKIYNIYHKVLNTKDYGIPQNRERIFIVGIRKEVQKREFNFPKKKKMKKIESFIDNKNNEKEKPYNYVKNKIKKINDVCFLDLCFIKTNNFENYKEYSPSLTTYKSLYCLPKKRYASVKEKLKLQGFPTNFKQVISDTQMSKQIGNSMSVNVLIEIFKCIFNSI